jgi:hypothetical protein
MNNLASKQMQQTIETILKSLGVYDRFRANNRAYLKVGNSGFMPLSIEKFGSLIHITHYYEQNGDLVPDPDMEFLATAEGWFAQAIQHCTGHYFRCVEEDEAGNIQVNIRERRAQKQFSDLWARNLLDQGFHKGEIMASAWG